VPPVAAKRIRGVVAAAERARHQVRRADRPRSGRPPRGDWYAVAPLAVGAVRRGNQCADKTSGSPCLSVHVRMTSVFFFGIRPSFGTIAQLAVAVLQLAVGARVAPQLHRRRDSGERVVHGWLFEPGHDSVARRASAEFPLAIERGAYGHALQPLLRWTTGARMARPAGDTRIPGTKQEPARVGSALSYLIRTVSEGGVRKGRPPSWEGGAITLEPSVVTRPIDRGLLALADDGGS
jgi:hypothetical protein